MKSTRETIVECADRLFYRRGFEHTSFADLAEAVGITRGNFYHHFPTKDLLLESVIELRTRRTRELLERWEAEASSPQARLVKFIELLIKNRTPIRKHGCPVGTLCTELSKLAHPAEREAQALFALFREWLTRQFQALGREEDADRCALHLLMRSQGIAVLTNAFEDDAFLEREVEAAREWLLEFNRPEPHPTPP